MIPNNVFGVVPTRDLTIDIIKIASTHDRRVLQAIETIHGKYYPLIEKTRVQG